MKKLFLLSITMLFLSFYSCGGSKASTSDGKTVQEIKLAHNLPEGHAVDKAFRYFAEQVAKYSDNTMKVIIYPNEQLGNQKATIQLGQSGGVELFHTNISLITDYAPVLNLLNLPYVFQSDEHYNKFMSSPVLRSEFDKILDKGFIPITSFDGGIRNFYIKSKPINSLEDMKGLKIRVMDNSLYIDMIRLLGGSPVAMAGGEIYTALQQGVIDGAENTEVTYLAQKHNEIAPYYSRSKMLHTSEILSAGAPFWSKITKEQQDILLKAGNELRAKYSELWDASMKEAIDTLSTSGTKFNDIEIEPFKEKIMPLHTQYTEQGPEFKAFYDQLKALEK